MSVLINSGNNVAKALLSNNVHAYKAISILHSTTSTRFEDDRMIRYYLWNAKFIGEGAGGKVYSIGVSNAGTADYVDDLFVIKIPRDGDFTNEVPILKNLNTLRNRTPNFSYFFGIVFCMPSGYSGSRVFDHFNDSLSNQEALLIEYAKGSQEFGDWIIGKSREDIGSVVAQILYSLQIAYDEYKFTHYDLYPNNILVEDLGEDMYFEYKFGDEVKRVVSRYKAVIIDFELSYLKTEENEFSIEDKDRYVEKKPNPSHDVSALLYNLFGDLDRLLLDEGINYGNFTNSRFIDYYEYAQLILPFFGLEVYPDVDELKSAMASTNGDVQSMVELYGVEFEGLSVELIERVLDEERSESNRAFIDAIGENLNLEGELLERVNAYLK